MELADCSFGISSSGKSAAGKDKTGAQDLISWLHYGFWEVRRLRGKLISTAGICFQKIN